mgnify:CR=1 FL=1
MLESVGRHLHGDPVDASKIKQLRDLVLFEKQDLEKTGKIFCLLIISSCIATYRLLENSGAVVIEAMIIASLMIPIMCLAFGISIGDSYSTKNSPLLLRGEL